MLVGDRIIRVDRQRRAEQSLRFRQRARCVRDVRRDRLETNVVHVHLVARGAQARRHAPAHRAQPDVTEIGHLRRQTLTYN